MKKLVLTCLLALSTSPAFAGGAEMRQFFDLLEGRWDGRGAVTQIGHDGRSEVVGYDQEVEIDDYDRDTWTTHSETEFDNSMTEIGDNRFTVRGDVLLVGQYSPVEPVGVKESTPTKLVYTMRRVELYTGRVFDFTFSLEYVAEKRVLAGRNTIELNNLVISDDRFELKKW
jgi:hypothetical protein